MGWATSLITDLEAGKTVTCRPKGNSMLPHIKSGQLCTISPVTSVERGDIVLCKVNGRQYLHFVKAIKGNQYLIVNSQGHENGWTTQIYGKLTNIDK